MPQTNMGCVTPEELTQNKEVRKRRTATQLDDIQRRINELDQELNNGTKDTAVSERFRNQARISFRHKLNSAMRLMSNTFLRPGNNYSFSTWIAKNFAVWKTFGQLGEQATVPGAVRQTLKRAERLFTNDLPHTLGRMAVNERIRASWKEMLDIKRRNAVDDKTFNDLAVEAVELSYSRWAKQYYNVGSKGLEFIKGRFEQFLKKMDDAGIPEDDQEKILQLGKQTADDYHHALDLAQRMGINVDQLENMEFFPRQMSEDLMRRFRWNQEETGEYRLGDGQRVTLGQAFMKSRNTNNYVVEDEIVLHAFMDANKIWDELPKDIKHPNDLFDPDNSNVVAEKLFNSLSDAQLEALVESGILSKVPMSSPEFREWASKKFPLPSDNLNTLMQTDWLKAFQGYQRQLKKASGQSGIIWSMIANAVGMDGNKQPWGVTKAEVNADPDTYSDFKPLFPEKVGDTESVISEEMMNTFVRSNADKQGEIPQIYVHPVAKELFEGMMDMTQDPGKLGVVADHVRHFTNTFKRMLVTSVHFMTQQFINPMVQMWTAGGNFLNYPNDVAKTLNLMRLTRFRNVGDKLNPIKSDSDPNFTFEEAMKQTFDNTRKVYRGINGEMVTELELYRQGRKLGFLNDYIPGVGGEISNEGTHFGFSPGNLAGNLKVMTANWQQLGALKGTAVNASDSLKLLNRATFDPVSAQLMLMTNEMENAGRFGTLKTLTFDRTQAGGKFLDQLQKSGQFVTTQEIKQFDNLESAVEHAQNYFFMFDDQGQMDSSIRDFVIPFWSFISRNPVAQLRGAIRHPVKYGNWLRLYQATNGREQTEEELGMPLENVVPWWVEEQRPLYWTQKEDETPDSAKRPFVFYLPTRQLDPVGDAFKSISNVGDQALQGLGVLPKEHENKDMVPRKKEDIKWLKSNTNSMLDMALKESYGPYKGIAGALLNREIGQNKEKLIPDPTKRRKETWLGVEFDPRVKYLLSETFPILQRLNARVAQIPGGSSILGQRGGYVISDDGQSVEIKEGKDSIFGAERTDFDKEAYYDDVAKRMEVVLGKPFFGVDFIDPMFQTANTIDELERNIENLGDQMRRQRDAIQQAQDADRRKELQTQLEAMIITDAKMASTLRALQEYAKKNGIKPKEAYRQIKQEKIDPPTLSPAKRREEMKKTLRKVFENTERVSEEVEDVQGLSDEFKQKQLDKLEEE